jgi:hypothetical protein
MSTPSFCLLLHKWDQCVCRKCGKTRHKVKGCMCLRCGEPFHDQGLFFCNCYRCGEVAHTWSDCRCTRCGDENHEFEDGICRRCGGYEDAVEEVDLQVANAIEFGLKQGLYIVQHPCRCGGAWEKRTTSFGTPRGTSVDCTCAKCGREKELIFAHP